MNPPKGMVSPRGPVFAAIIERVETPDPDTVVIHGKGPSGSLLPLFANGWNVIIPKHIAEKDSEERFEDDRGWHRAVSVEGTAHILLLWRSMNVTLTTLRKSCLFSMRSRST